MNPIYLDYNATTPVDPAVVEAMIPYLREHFGNPSSTHAYGKKTHEAVEIARRQVAELIGAMPEEIVFTGGGSEASNLAIKGFAFNKPRGLFGLWGRGTDLITGTIEHPATINPCRFLERLGSKLTVVPVDRTGVVDVDALKKAIRQPRTLISIMHSNNEVGTIQPIQEISKIAKERGAVVHTDVAQSLGKVKVDVNELGVDLLTIAGHKLYAPKGVGALYVRKGVKLEPLIHGAGHEHGLRAGTENVPYLVGLGKACELARTSLPEATDKLRSLRDRLWGNLQKFIGPKVHLNGHPQQRLPNTLNVSFEGQIGSEILERTPGIAASTGSACHEGQAVCSSILLAMGLSQEIARGTVRLSVGRFTTEEEVDRAAELLRDSINSR